MPDSTNNTGTPLPKSIECAMPAHASQDNGEGNPKWMESLQGQIWIAPDIGEVEADIAREMGA